MNGLPEEIVKVFTKYDVPFIKINVPMFKDLVAKPLSESSFPEPLDTDIIEYHLSKVEQGLEEVKFYHYKRR